MPFFPLYEVQKVNILRELIAQLPAERSWSDLNLFFFFGSLGCLLQTSSTCSFIYF